MSKEATFADYATMTREQLESHAAGMERRILALDKFLNETGSPIGYANLVDRVKGLLDAERREKDAERKEKDSADFIIGRALMILKMGHDLSEEDPMDDLSKEAAKVRKERDEYLEKWREAHRIASRMATALASGNQPANTTKGEEAK